MSKLRFTHILLITLLVLPSLASAQLLNLPESPQALVLKASPSSPAPGQAVIVEASSLSLDLDRAQISWSLNGTPYQAGVGMKKINLTMGQSGAAVMVSASVVSGSGERVSRSLTLRAGGVDLVWEAVSYTPPFYKGKGLLSHEAMVRVVAIPEPGSFSTAAEGLIYTWSKDGTVLGSLSGRGKNTLTFKMPQLVDNVRVSVEVAGDRVSERAAQSIALRSGDPLLLIYEKDSLLGLRFEKALENNVSLEGDEITLVGLPYFFSEENLASSKLQYSWRINRLGTGVTQSEITLRPKEGERGASQVSLKVDNMREIMQSAVAAINVVFGKEEGSSNPFF